MVCAKLFVGLPFQPGPSPTLLQKAFLTTFSKSSLFTIIYKQETKAPLIGIMLFNKRLRGFKLDMHVHCWEYLLIISWKRHKILLH